MTGIPVSDMWGEAMAVPMRFADLHVDGASLGDAVFHTVSQAIVDGTLEPGEQLRTSDLERWLGASRTPIRDALARLVAVGLVETQPGRFTRVTHLDDALAQETLEFTCYQGGAVARMAVTRMSPQQLKASLRMLEEMVPLHRPVDEGEFYDAHRNFVRHLTVGTGNRLFVRTAAELGALAERTLRRHNMVAIAAGERRASYLRLRDAMANRDPDYAEYAFRVIHRLTAVEGQRDGDWTASADRIPKDPVTSPLRPSSNQRTDRH